MGTYRSKMMQRYILLCAAGILVLYCGNQLNRIQTLEQNFEDQIKMSNEEKDVEARTFTDFRGQFAAALKADYRNLTKYPIFQSTVEVEFPTDENEIPRIPHIIHQICSNESIPDNFLIPMQSFVQQNPTWQYMFWTYDSGRKLLKERHPYLVDLYNKFINGVMKADLLRYAILYEFGGIYADLDVENLRPLNITTLRYACIIPTETFDHSTILNHMPMWLNTAVLLCRPKHPFFAQLLLEIQTAEWWDYPVTVTGPGFMTRAFMKYNNLELSDLSKPKIDNDTNSPYFYKGLRSAEDEDGIYIPNSQYFMDTVDPFLVENGDLRDCVDGREISYLAKRGCAEYEHRRKVRASRRYTFTVHYWFHLWVVDEKTRRSYGYSNIKHIIPKCVFY